jgi:hypothetical protein
VLVVKGGGGKQGGGGGRDRKRREKAPYAFVESSRFSGATPAIMRFSTAPHRTNPGPLPSSLNHFLGVRAVCSCVRFVSRYPSPKQVARHDPALPACPNQRTSWLGPRPQRRLGGLPAGVRGRFASWPVGRSSSGRKVWLTASLEGALRPAHSTCE